MELGLQNPVVWLLWFQLGARGPGLRLVLLSIEEALTKMPYAIFGAKALLGLPPQSAILSCCDSSRATEGRSASLNWTPDVGLLLGTEAWACCKAGGMLLFGEVAHSPSLASLPLPWPRHLQVASDLRLVCPL